MIVDIFIMIYEKNQYKWRRDYHITRKSIIESPDNWFNVM